LLIRIEVYSQITTVVAPDQQQDILYCVVTRPEIGSVSSLAREIDEEAFVIVHPLADASGSVIKKPLLNA